MANSYQLSRPEHWDPLGRAGLETHLGETEAALNDLEGALNAAASRLDGSINTVSSTLDGKITALSANLEGKINAVAAAREVVVGYYTGNGAATRNISLGFRPRAVLAELESGLRASSGAQRGTLVVDGMPLLNTVSIAITATGLQVHQGSDSDMNGTNDIYSYLAIK